MGAIGNQVLGEDFKEFVRRYKSEGGVMAEQPRTEYGPAYEFPSVQPTFIQEEAAWEAIARTHEKSIGVEPAKPQLGGHKNDAGKVRWSLLPQSIEEVIDVYTFGAKKYGDRNWEKGLAYSRMYDALMRHLQAWWYLGHNSFSEIDEKTGEESVFHPLAAVCFYALGLMEFEATGTGDDDRVCPG